MSSITSFGRNCSFKLSPSESTTASPNKDETKTASIYNENLNSPIKSSLSIAKHALPQRYMGPLENGIPHGKGGELVLGQYKITNAECHHGVLLSGTVYDVNENRDIKIANFKLPNDSKCYNIMENESLPKYVESIEYEGVNGNGNRKVGYGPINERWQLSGSAKLEYYDKNSTLVQEIHANFVNGEMDYTHPPIKTTRYVTHKEKRIPTFHYEVDHNNSGHCIHWDKKGSINSELIGVFNNNFELISGKQKLYANGKAIASINQGTYHNEVLHGKQCNFVTAEKISGQENTSVVIVKLAEGEFKAGLLNGEGTYELWKEHYPNLRLEISLHGHFKKGTFTFGTAIKNVEGLHSIQTGQFKGTLLNGTGKITTYDSQHRVTRNLEGSFSEGKLSGKGRIVATTWQNHDEVDLTITVSGCFKDGLLVGKENTYQITEYIQNDQPSLATENLPPTVQITTSTGEFDHNFYLVNGTRKHENGNNRIVIHSGKFKEGKLINGITTINKNFYFKGKLIDNNFDGKAKLVIDGVEYKATFENGNIKNNHIEYATSDGTYYQGQGTIDYTGEYPQIYAHGIGSIEYSNGVKQTGSFNRGKAEGAAKRSLANGNWYLCNFSNDSLVGTIDYYYSNGKSFHEIDVTASLAITEQAPTGADQPSTKQDCSCIDQYGPSGIGTILLPNNISIDGSLIQGKLEGQAFIRFPNGESYFAEYNQNKLVNVNNLNSYLQTLTKFSKDKFYLELQVNSQSYQEDSIDNLEQLIPSHNQAIDKITLDKSTELNHKLSPYWLKYQLLANQFNHSFLLNVTDNAAQLVNADQEQARVISLINEINSIDVTPELKTKKTGLINKFSELKNLIKKYISQLEAEIKLSQDSSAQNSGSGYFHEFKVINPHDQLSANRLIINQKLWSKLPKHIQQLLANLKGEILLGNGNPHLKYLDDANYEIKFQNRNFGDLRIGCVYDKDKKVIMAQEILDHKGIERWLNE